VQTSDQIGLYPLELACDKAPTGTSNALYREVYYYKLMNRPFVRGLMCYMLW
jgi:hypothetical protein